MTLPAELLESKTGQDMHEGTRDELLGCLAEAVAAVAVACCDPGARVSSRAEVERRWRERYIPSQELYFATVHPADRADVVVHNDEPQQPVWQLAARSPGRLRHAMACRKLQGRSAPASPPAAVPAGISADADGRQGHG